MNNKIFRSDLFKHIDGIALIPSLACIFKKNNKILNLITSVKPFMITQSDLKLFSINGDYLNVTLRLFESQGWIKRKLTHNNSIEIKTTKHGLNIFKNLELYKKFFPFYSYLTKLTK